MAATYMELFGLQADSDLQDKVAVAAVIKAQGLLDGATPTTDEVTWASNTLSNPKAEAKRLLPYVLAANKTLEVAQIEGASDAAIQTNVDDAADALIAGGAV